MTGAARTLPKFIHHLTIRNEVMNSMLKDIRYGVRSLMKQPGFTARVVLSN